MINADNITVRINDKNILKDVDFISSAGEMTFILGPNGAGKSTLLKCLSGILKPNAGQITLDGQALAELSLNNLAKKRAVLSQSNTVDFPFTAVEIVMMGRNPHSNGYHNEKDSEIVDEVLTTVDAYALKNRVFSTLSGGEQQRIQLARVLAQVWGEKDAHLLLDEPTTALDLKHQHQILQCLKTLATEKQWTIIIVIHDLHLAKMYSDHIVFMQNGEVFKHISANAFHPENISAVFEISTELAEWYGDS